jgi:RND family efflux transporter MFP subunit
LKFKLNQSVEVAADIYTGKSFKGKVSNISVQADKSHNFKVQITIPNGKQEIMAGMYGSVSLNNAESITALAIPRKALIGSSKNPQVYVIRGGKSLLISFNAGTSDGEFIEVVNGLQSNDQIITKGQVNIQDKSNVKIKK